MRSLIILSAICQVIILTEAQNGFSSLMSFYTNGGEKCKEGQKGRVCKDCNTVAICDEEGYELISYPCELISGEEFKFCSGDGNCVKIADCNNQGQEDTLDCPKYPSFFPNPNKCNQFFFCDGVQEKAIAYSCFGKARYDKNNKICSGTITTCQTYGTEKGELCYNKPLQALIVTPDSSSYVICPPKGSATVLKTCPNENEKFDLKTLSCTFTCTKEGFFPHSDVTKYYECIREGTRLRKEVQTCKNSSEFDSKKGFCSGGANIPPEDNDQIITRKKN